jgi:hypothetical protein
MDGTNMIRYGGNQVRYMSAMPPDGGRENSPRAARYSIAVELPEELSPLCPHLEYLGRGISLVWCNASLPADVEIPFRVERAALSFTTLLSGSTECALSSRSGRKTLPVWNHPGEIGRAHV